MCAVHSSVPRSECQVSFTQSPNSRGVWQAAMGHFFLRFAFYFAASAYHHTDGIGGAGIEQDHTEFIVAQTAQNIPMPDRSLHIFRKGDKSPVPRAMSQLVVKRLDIVDVGDNPAQVTSMPERIGDENVEIVR